ncbi:carbohydrate-binding protein [Streptacidiphilus albus]|uniref:carbohydrate-binding protein n=2 Tax=Streptacidiphilus albus TaxID=105425 RepID=UPI000A4BC76E|nr:carbohydrate-binding protein [Streptacidiphilus albus]
MSIVGANTAAYAAADAPYGGTAAAVPGTVQAENYDTGGQGTAYSVTAVNGSGNSYRSDGVDLEATTDTGGGYDLGWTGAGQWFKYTVNAAAAGTYAVSLRLAAPTAVTDALHIANAAGTNLSGSIAAPATGGYQTWTTVTTTVTLTAGAQTLTLDQDNPGWNINYLTFANSDAPYGGTAAALPGTVQAENYDTGGQGTAYSVTAVNGSGNSYRSDGVDLEATTDTGGGYDLGWTGAGQWFNYTVNAATAGTYTVSLRLAAPTAVTDALHIANAAGTNLSGNINTPATGGYQTWTTVTTTVTLPAGQQTLRLDQDNPGWNINYLTFATSGSGTPPPATGGSLGSNVIVFTPSEPEATIQSELTSLGSQQNPNQFGTQRYELLFEPGTYGTAASPLDFQVGYYEAVAGLGQNPGQTVINGTIDSYNQCPGGVQTNCNATDNFWRSITNLTINVAGLTGCFAGDEVWASSQDSPLRRVDINGNTTLMDFCDGSPDYASGGYIGDSDLNGTVTNGSQQQYFTQDTTVGSWSNAVWNQVFCGAPGAPAQSFAGNSGDSGGPASYTTLANCPVSEQEPYLYQDSSGNYDVFVPSVQSNTSGPSWSGGSTPGTSLSVNNTFYVVNASSTITQINAALAAGDNLLFTPGVYSYASAINVTKADTKIIGLGFATLIPTAGNVTMNVADVPGVNVSGLIFDAGPVNSPVLLQVGAAGSTANNAADPVTVDDVSFRIGGAEAGSATTSFVDDSNNSIIDDVWAWRADHGTGVGWTANTGANGLIVNGNSVSAYGLAVEHYQGYEVEWNGQNGELLFFQNENPYDVPSQSAWMSSSTQDGYPAIYVPNSVTSFTGYGLGSYSYFDQGVAIENAMAFQVPTTSGIHMNDLLTVFLNGSGGIASVVDGTGAAVSSTNIGPSDVVSFN